MSSGESSPSDEGQRMPMEDIRNIDVEAMMAEHSVPPDSLDSRPVIMHSAHVRKTAAQLGLQTAPDGTNHRSVSAARDAAADFR